MNIIGRRLNNLRFPDDIVLIATSPKALQRMLDEVDRVSTEFRLEFSTKRRSLWLLQKEKKTLNITCHGLQEPYLNKSTSLTRHRASTSMYSLIFYVRLMSPERHHLKPAVQAAAVMLRTPPSTASYRPASHARFPFTARNFENAPVTRRSPASSARRPRRALTLCCDSWMDASL